MRFASLAVALVVLGSCAPSGKGEPATAPQPNDAAAGVSPRAVPRPVTTLRAALTGEPTTPIEADLRVAILWQAYDAGEDASRIHAQDVGIARTWPVRFTLDLAPTPPAGAIGSHMLGTPGGPTQPPILQRAVGKIVVYEDRNGNHALDSVPEGSETPIDVLRGADDDLFLEWVNATDADWPAVSLGMARGMNLVRRPGSQLGVECFDKPCEAFGEPRVLPPDEEVLISTSVSPLAYRLVCEKFVGIDSTAGDVGTPCPTPLPSPHGVICLGWDRSKYVVVLVDEPLPLCNVRGHVRYCGIERDPAAPPPAGWPCP